MWYLLPPGLVSPHSGSASVFIRIQESPGLAREVLHPHTMAIFEALMRKLGYVRLRTYGLVVAHDGRLVPQYPLVDPVQAWRSHDGRTMPLMPTVDSTPHLAVPTVPPPAVENHAAPVPPAAQTPAQSAAAHNAVPPVRQSSPYAAAQRASNGRLPPTAPAKAPVASPATAPAAAPADDTEWEQRLAAARARAEADERAPAPPPIPKRRPSARRPSTPRGQMSLASAPIRTNRVRKQMPPLPQRASTKTPLPRLTRRTAATSP